MDIVLRTNSANPSLSLRGVTFGGGAESVYSARLVVRSGNFSGDHPFSFSEAGCQEFLAALTAANDALAGTARLAEPHDEYDFLELRVGSRGQVTVVGRLVQYSLAGNQEFSFAFATDQTVLEPLIRDLRSLVQSGSAATR